MRLVAALVALLIAATALAQVTRASSPVGTVPASAASAVQPCEAGDQDPYAYRPARLQLLQPRRVHARDDPLALRRRADQRHDNAKAKHRRGDVARLKHENTKLRARRDALRNPAALEREARRLGMVRPGERSYVVKHLPKGAKLHTAGFKTCQKATLEQTGPSACPARSKAGPVGKVIGIVAFGKERVEEEAELSSFFAPGGGLQFFTFGHSPVLLEILSTGKYVNLNGGGGFHVGPGEAACRLFIPRRI